MDRNFTRCLGAVLEEEGGFADHPKDPGGATMRGVTFANFKAYVKPDGTIADLKALTAEQAGVVYRREYWDKVLGAELPDGVDHSVFDFAVNSGPSRAAKYLQAIVGVKVDGAIGPKTLEAVRATDSDFIIQKLFARRLAFLQGLDTWPVFRKGWEKRVKNVRALSLELALQPPEPAVVVEKHIDVDRPVPEPVIPKGADKQGSSWWMGILGYLGSVASAFVAADLTTKLLLLGVTTTAFAFFIWRGRDIARKIKAIVAEFGA